MYVNAIKSICQIFALVWLVQNSIIQCHFTALRRLVYWLIFKWWIKAETGSLVSIQACEYLPSETFLRSGLPTSLLLPGLRRENVASSQQSPASFPTWPLPGKVTQISYL